MSGEWYHCRLKPISRSAGRSAVACAAYRSGMALQDERYGTMRDFSRKSDVVTTFTLAPEGAPDWARDVAQLWNAVEAKENRKNSQLAFEWEAALPYELDDAKREEIAQEFSGWLVDEYGVAVTVGIHSGGSRGNGRNDHMHVMMTTREVGPDGWGGKLREFNTRPGAKNPEVERVREQLADLINDALDEAGSDERVSHLSFKARGIDKEPTRHLGPAATSYERQGYETDQGDINRAIIEERLQWQMEAAQPVITAELEAEFAARFGDEQHQRRLEEALAGGPVPVDVVEHATAAAEPASPDVTLGAERVLAPPRGWRERMRAIRDAARELWADETSGRPDAERGLFARVLDTCSGAQ
jgi:hypothetical protein